MSRLKKTSCKCQKTEKNYLIGSILMNLPKQLLIKTTTMSTWLTIKQLTYHSKTSHLNLI